MYVFSFDYPPCPGGIARFCSEVATELERRHVLYGVISTGASVASRSGGTARKIPSRRPWSELRALEFLAGRPDRQPVLCGRWWPEGAIALAAGRGDCVVLAHGAELLKTEDPRGKVRAPLRRWVLERSALVVANSHFTARLVRHAAPRSRCVALPLAVDAERFCPGDSAAARARIGLPLSPRIVLTVARIHAFKGHVTVLRALALLAPEVRREIRYAIVGSGPYESELKRITAEAGLAESVVFLGFLEENQLPDAYRSADLHALLTEQTTGDVEGFGLSSLEAQACGVPALVVDSGGASDAIGNNGGGWLVPPADAARVAGHLEALVKEPAAYRAAGHRARERVLASCTWPRYADQLLASISQTLDGDKTR